MGKPSVSVLLLCYLGTVSSALSYVLPKILRKFETILGNPLCIMLIFIIYIMSKVLLTPVFTWKIRTVFVNLIVEFSFKYSRGLLPVLRYDLRGTAIQRINCLGQSPSSVWRWRQIRSFKVNIQTVNAPISASKVSILKLTIEGHFKLIRD